MRIPQTSKLQLELTKEQHMNTMLQDRITRVEEEKDSLRLALKLLMQDQNANNATPTTNDSVKGWKTVTRTNSRIEHQSEIP